MTVGFRRSNQVSEQMYHVPLRSHALDILELVQQGNNPYSLEVIYTKSGVAKSTTVRVLKTFVHLGYISKTDNGRYRFVTHPKESNLAMPACARDFHLLPV
jgi:ribose transport system substrate-binding protein